MPLEPCHQRPFLLAVAATAFLAGCGKPSSPGLSSLRLGMGYDELAELAGGQGEHDEDRGVRVVRWRFPDDSEVEAGVRDGYLSGMRIHAAGRGAAARAWRATRRGIRDDMSEWELREHLAMPSRTVDDTSDRECRWTWPDGSLTARFERGMLVRAVWQPGGGAEEEVLVEPGDPLEVLLLMLRSERPSDRYRALVGLRPVKDRRIDEALLELLAEETESANRGLAALVLAEHDVSEASALLLRDLEAPIISDQLLEALARIGDRAAAHALSLAESRAGSVHTRGRIHSARARILDRLER